MYNIYWTVRIILTVYFWFRALKSTLLILTELEHYRDRSRRIPNTPRIYGSTIRYTIITWIGLAILMFVG